MAITFRKFAASARLSQETTAYDTQVLFDKKLIGTCSNDGRGGMGHFWPESGAEPDLVSRAEAWANQQPVLDWDGTPMARGGQTMYHQGIADYCDTLADKTLADKQLRSSLQRLLKTHVLFTCEDTKGPGVFQIKRPWTKELEPHFRNKYPEAVVLNELPFGTAMKVFERQTRLAQDPSAGQVPPKAKSPSP